MPYATMYLASPASALILVMRFFMPFLRLRVALFPTVSSVGFAYGYFILFAVAHALVLAALVIDFFNLRGGLCWTWALLVLVYLGIMFHELRRARKFLHEVVVAYRANNQFCVVCGYDLRGLPFTRVCSECAATRVERDKYRRNSVVGGP